MDVRSLDEARANIDRLDRDIIRAMAEREFFVRQAARFKATPDDVKAPPRVEQVIARVRAHAAEAGLEPKIAEITYRAMIAAFIDLEQGVLETKSGSPRFSMLDDKRQFDADQRD